jgi:prophage maintenance system killer protein
MREITLETITGMHDAILAKDGGDCRIISEGNLYQLVFQANLTEDPVSRAATVFWLLCAYPGFREGNRRTAHRLAEAILISGGITASLPCDDMRALTRGIDAFTVEIDDVVRLLRDRVEKGA